jgi:hypothetical protein
LAIVISAQSGELIAHARANARGAIADARGARVGVIAEVARVARVAGQQEVFEVRPTREGGGRNRPWACRAACSSGKTLVVSESLSHRD